MRTKQAMRNQLSLKWKSWNKIITQ
jgi:hypothetical protein